MAFQGWAMLVSAIAIIGLIDFLTIGYFRKFKLVNRILWPIHQFISALTLSRFYRPIYYSLVTNFKWWTVAITLTCFIATSIFSVKNMTWSNYSGQAFSRITTWSSDIGKTSFVGYYEDQYENLTSVQSHIPSDIIEGDVLKLFVVADLQKEKYMEKLGLLNKLKQPPSESSRSDAILDAIQDFYTIKIDSDTVIVENWLFAYDTKQDQRGHLTYLDISHLNKGLHFLRLSIPNRKGYLAEIPFYKTSTY
jgi:hypothetical protein